MKALAGTRQLKLSLKDSVGRGRGVSRKPTFAVAEGSGGGPRFIREMPLDVLSREASFLYVVDFRTGKNSFARGSLMAAEMDDRIRAKTEQKKSLRDGLRAVLTWSAKNQRAFQVEELGDILSESTGVDVRDILERWSKAPRSTQQPQRLSK